ncbi:transposase, partial [Pseudoalteromonas sp. S1688]|uniref:transposase n=1 Tax=Pseudoalteromonas sp. S1688 TaxID=579511 RepID=UPI00110C04AE
LMWLLGKLAPDFKTIADFRKDNGDGIKNVCKTFVEVCRRLNMFEKPVVAIDGSKFKASNNKGNNFTPSKVKFHIDRVEKNIERYLELLDEADKEQANVTKIKATKDRLADFRSQLKKLHEIKEQVEAHPDKQISTTDPDSRLMKTQGFTRVVSYNVQSAVDTKHHLIVAHEVTNVPDRGQLASMTKLAQKALRKEDIRVLADKGYFSQPDIKDTIDLGAEPIMPKTDTSSSEKKGIFNRSLFKYDANKDIYLCPAGNELQNRMQVFEQGKYLEVLVHHIA